MKFEDFMRSYDIFQSKATRNPLIDILGLFDILSDGKAHEVLSFQNSETVDVATIAEKRRQGVPLEYILGRATFMGKTFFCSSDTLIPRPETSLLVKVASDFIRKKGNNGSDEQTVIEIGTGCGNIAVSLALLCDRDVRILASDISHSAVEVAHWNVQKFGLQEKVILFSGDLFEPFYDYQGSVDMVICNPPYIPTHSLEKLDKEIIDHEPVVALDGGPYGIEFLRRLIKGASSVLKPEGILLFEIGEGQEKLLERLLAKKGAYKDIEHFKCKEKVRVFSAVKK